MALTVMFSFPAWAEETITGKAWVHDGDTITVEGHKIRLVGIDAPELKQRCTTAGKQWNCGGLAKVALIRMVKGKQVSCRWDKLDKYHRLLATCELPGGKNINRAMVTQGWAVAFMGSGQYTNDQEIARRNGKGIWNSIFLEPHEWRMQYKKLY